jgi:hypothetical protein
MAKRIFTASSIALTLTLVAAACGGSESTEPAENTTTVTADPVTTTVVAEEPTTTTIASTTTTEAPPVGIPIPIIDAADIPELITAWGDGTAPALELAQNIIGFPIEIAAVSDGGALDVRVGMRGDDPDLPWA